MNNIELFLVQKAEILVICSFILGAFFSYSLISLYMFYKKETKEVVLDEYGDEIDMDAFNKSLKNNK